MPIPLNAKALTETLDPRDLDVYAIALRRDGTDKATLDTSESIASYTLALRAEAVAIGLIIQDAGAYAPTNSETAVRFWLSVDPSRRADAIFDGAGVTVGMELTFVTTATPPREKQKTVTVQVAQQ